MDVFDRTELSNLRTKVHLGERSLANGVSKIQIALVKIVACNVRMLGENVNS